MCPTQALDDSQPLASALPTDVFAAGIFALLQPRDLCRASAVCRLWRQLASDAAWHRFYGQLWPVQDADTPPGFGGWQTAYGQKMLQSKSWRGRATQDKLFGHSAAVRCLSMHVSSNLLFTGSLDRTVRAWDLRSGVQVAVSRPHGGTVRCLASSDGALLFSGSSDHLIRAWRCGQEAGGGGGGAALVQRAVLGGHAGPVTALALAAGALFSGSWDYSVRAWDPQRLRCTAAVHVEDWVSCLAAQPPSLYVGCGREVLVFGLGAGGLQQAAVPAAVQAQAAAAREPARAAVTAVQGSLDGRYLFFGTGDGSVVGSDLRCREQQGQRVLLQDASGVTGLSWEYPCLGASFQRGQVALLDAEAAMGQSPASPPAAPGAGGKPRGGRRAAAGPPPPWVRWLSPGSGGEAASCVALGDEWVAAGCDSGAVATWDFSQALQLERAAVALRQRKQQRRLSAAAARAAAGGGGGRRAHV